MPTAVRQGLFYALMYAGTGASLPFMPVWFKAHGLSASQIALILAVPLILRGITGPLSGVWADRFALYRTPLISIAFSAALAYALMVLGPLYGSWRFGVFLVLWTIGYTGSSNLGPLADAMTVQLARRLGFTYALPRAMGSAAFIVANLGVGAILLVTNSESILIWLVAAALGVALAASFMLEPLPRQDYRQDHRISDTPHEPGFKRIQVLLSKKGYLGLLIALGCLQGAHSFYYAFSTLLWKAQGLSSGICGMLWATGVVAEVAFMSLGERLRRCLGPWRLLVVAAVFSVVRWAAMALSPPLWLLWPIQALHAMSFAATFLAGLELVHHLTPKGYEGLGQTMNGALTAGLMVGIGTLASGPLFEHFGNGGYVVMTVLAAGGLVSALWLYMNRTALIEET